MQLLCDPQTHLSGAPDAAAEAAEGDGALVVDDVLQVPLGLVQLHALQRVGRLPRVLEVHPQVAALGLRITKFSKSARSAHQQTELSAAGTASRHTRYKLPVLARQAAAVLQQWELRMACFVGGRRDCLCSLFSSGHR